VLLALYWTNLVRPGREQPKSGHSVLLGCRLEMDLQGVGGGMDVKHWGHATALFSN